MKKATFPALLLLAALWLAAFAQPALATPSVPPVKPETPGSFLPIAAQLGEQLQTLVNAAAGNEVPPPEQETEIAPTFGTRALNLLIGGLDMLGAKAHAVVTNFSALPQLSGWWKQQSDDPRLSARWEIVGNDLLHIVGFAFLAALALELLLMPARTRLRARSPESFAGRLAILAALFALRALPLILFIGASVSLLDRGDTQKLSRFIILNVVYALALGRAVLALIRGLLAPHVARLRLLPIANAQAVYAARFLGIFSLVVIFGYFCVDVAHAVRVPDAVIAAFGSLLGFGLMVMAMIAIVQKRVFVASLIRGRLAQEREEDLSWAGSLRLWVARRWHILAIAYLLVGYAIAVLGVANGYAVMLRGTAWTLLILVAVRFAHIGLDHWGERDERSGRLTHYAMLRALIRAAVWCAALLGIAEAWGANIPGAFATPLGQRLAGSVLSIAVTIAIVSLIYEALRRGIDRHLEREEKAGRAAGSRAHTLLPMLRNSAFVVGLGIIALVALSEAGINVGPLLAGAGVLGVAVGFGSQALVKDLLTGLFIAAENTIAIGNVVKIGDRGGVVEAMGFRALHLRDTDGSLHVVPYGEVAKVTNLTKGFAFAVIDASVAYDTDLDHAMGVIRGVGEELRQDPIFKAAIVEPLEMWGVEELGDFAIRIRARLRTRPGKQWDVKRAFLLRMKKRFDAEGIEIPFPTRIQIQKREDMAEALPDPQKE